MNYRLEIVDYRDGETRAVFPPGAKALHAGNRQMLFRVPSAALLVRTFGASAEKTASPEEYVISCVPLPSNLPDGVGEFVGVDGSYSDAERAVFVAYPGNCFMRFPS